jgi:hypothetical protein
MAIPFFVKVLIIVLSGLLALLLLIALIIGVHHRISPSLLNASIVNLTNSPIGNNVTNSTIPKFIYLMNITTLNNSVTNNVTNATIVTHHHHSSVSLDVPVVNPEVPEFNIFAGLIAMIGALGIFVWRRDL